jgi:hypothetical protein
MLYKIIHDQNVFDLNPEIHAIPEFSKLLTTTANVKEEDRDRRMKFTILVADRRSPLRTLPDKERREKAAKIVGCKMEGNRLDRNARDWVDGNNESIEKAILKYRELQKDENAVALDSKEALIQSNLDFINDINKRTPEQKKDKQYGKDLELANKLAKQLPELYEAKQKLEEVLGKTSENKPELTTYTNLDIPDTVEEGSESLSLIDQFHLQNKK